VNVEAKYNTTEVWYDNNGQPLTPHELLCGWQHQVPRCGVIPVAP
jgi:hypothetical protein